MFLLVYDGIHYGGLSQYTSSELSIALLDLSAMNRSGHIHFNIIAKFEFWTLSDVGQIWIPYILTLNISSNLLII